MPCSLRQCFIRGKKKLLLEQFCLLIQTCFYHVWEGSCFCIQLLCLLPACNLGHSGDAEREVYAFLGNLGDMRQVATSEDSAETVENHLCNGPYAAVLLPKQAGSCRGSVSSDVSGNEGTEVATSRTQSEQNIEESRRTFHKGSCLALDMRRLPGIIQNIQDFALRSKLPRGGVAVESLSLISARGFLSSSTASRFKCLGLFSPFSALSVLWL